MPFIKADISVKLSRDQKRDLYKALGEHITCFAGKSEHGLMTEICDECFMSHGGEAHPAIACFQVKLFGKQEDECFLNFTKKVCRTCEDRLAIPAEHVYIVYESAPAWGNNYENS